MLVGDGNVIQNTSQKVLPIVTSTSSNALTQFLSQASNLSVLCVGSYLVILGDISLGQLIAFRIISGYKISSSFGLQISIKTFNKLLFLLNA